MGRGVALGMGGVTLGLALAASAQGASAESLASDFFRPKPSVDELAKLKQNPVSGLRFEVCEGRQIGEDLTMGLTELAGGARDLYPLNDLNNAYLFYLNGSAKLGQLTLNPAIGFGRNNAVDADSLEIDLLFDLPITKQLTLSGYALYVDFSVPVAYNYYQLGTALSLSF